MARVAIVSYDVQTIFGKAGGVGAFTTRWANLLRAHGDDVTIVMTRIDWEPMRVDPDWRARYQAAGIGLIELQTPPPLPDRWPEVPTMRAAELAAPVLAGFDVVYFQDWGNAAFHLVRERRFQPGIQQHRGPICVTVLHGPSEWELSSNHKYPQLPRDPHLAYQERYAARYSDFVVSPSRYMVEQVTSLGWQLPGGPDSAEVLGLPMPVPTSPTPAATRPKRRTRIVYFGRVEERKGIRSFVKALEYLAPTLTIKPEIVLLGGMHPDDTALVESALTSIRKAGFSVTHLAALASDAAQEFLSRHAAETLCVVPSPADNHPYSVVEASLIPGLNLVVSNGGGVPEILQHAPAQTTNPHPRDLAAKLGERLAAPLAADELARYDCAAANTKWLAFHAKAVALGATRKAAVPARESTRAKKLTLDVCVTYYQKAPYLGQLVTALEHQTDRDFHVIAVNDGSPDEESNRVFAQFAEQTKAHGWDFYRQENLFVDAARNRAARRGTGELILFVDADDIPAHNAVERLRQAITESGDDLILPASYLFASEGPPADPASGKVLQPAFATCIPLGMDLVGGLVDPSAFGGSMFIVRRTAFAAINGFRELRGAGHEDWELYVRLTLAGYKVDVLPEMLQFYRQVEGSLARTLPSEASRRRLIDAYEAALQPLGLAGAALALDGLFRAGNRMEARIAELEARAHPPQAKYAFFSGITQRFETDANGVGGLRQWYRERVSLETRLKLHQKFIAPLLGQHKATGYKPPPA
jgi:GT2 family glycosyltransferase/glycosyltransferase involved in cell wall biosynthesis